MNIPSSNFKKVKQFNTVFGHPTPSNHVEDIFTTSPNVVKLRNSLIREEIEELNNAYNDNDIVEIIDALSDILYVAYGLLVVYGVDGDIKYTEHIDMKINTLGHSREDKVRKFSNFIQTKDYISRIVGISFETTPVTFIDTLKENNFKMLFESHLLDLSINLEELEKSTSVASPKFSSVVSNCLSIIYITYLIGILIGVDLDTSVGLVHSSNMSKICSSEEEAEKTVAWYKENETRYDSPKWRKAEEGYVIFNESTGKILKNINYKAVDLTVMIN